MLSKGKKQSTLTMTETAWKMLRIASEQQGVKTGDFVERAVREQVLRDERAGTLKYVSKMFAADPEEAFRAKMEPVNRIAQA